MRCPVCEADIVCREGSHHYEECGLDNVYLENIEIWACKCGEVFIGLPAVPQLHRSIAQEILQKKSLLNGKEIRFLRKNMGLKTNVLSEYLGVTHHTISRWENGKLKISRSHDRFFRLIYATINGLPIESTQQLITEHFAEITKEGISDPPYKIPKSFWTDDNAVCTA